MSFRTRIFLTLAAVSLLPLALAAFFSFSANRDELERTVGRAQASVAEEVARGCERYLAQALQELRISVGILPLAQLTREERRMVLTIPYRQLEFVRALALFDGDGDLMAPAVSGPRSQGEPAMDAAELRQFLARAPLVLALQTGTAIGAPYRGGAEARLAVALRLHDEPARVVAGELSLAEFEHRLRQVKGAGIALIADGRGEILAGTVAGPITDSERDLLAAASAGKSVSRVVTGADGASWLASAAPVPTVGWGVLVAQPAEEAFRPAHRVRLYTAFWAGVALLLIAILGLITSASLTGPMKKLSHAAERLVEGIYEVDLDIERRDEIGRLADGFRRMTAAIRRRDDEIRVWNSQLQRRVDDRTRELRAAQDQILRTRRLAAIGSLGAGIAHELNNPLTAVTGLLTLLRRDLKGSPHEETAERAHEQAMRVARIVADVRAFAERQTAPGRPFPLDRPVRAALDLYAEQLARHNIRVTADLAADARQTQGDPAQIQQVVAHLLQNAIQAMPRGGELKLQLSDIGGEALKLIVSDTGQGIPEAIRERIFDPFFTTKAKGAEAGLGLSICNSIVEAHHGRIVVDSQEGRGATFTIFLPAAAPAAHLV